jgi:hypothetical protein
MDETVEISWNAIHLVCTLLLIIDGAIDRFSCKI